MNCCDANGKCTGGTGCAARTVRSCDELDLCQGHNPRCSGCTTPQALTARGALANHRLRFAPGALEGYRAPFFGSPVQRRELKRWLWGSLAISSAAIAAGLILGLLFGSLQ